MSLPGIFSLNACYLLRGRSNMGVELRTLHLLSRYCTSSAMPTALFAYYFWDRAPHYAWAGLDHDPPIYASLCSWAEWHHAHLLVEMGNLENFLPGLPWTIILPISTSWIARITSLSHHAWWMCIIFTQQNLCSLISWCVRNCHLVKGYTICHDAHCHYHQCAHSVGYWKLRRFWFSPEISSLDTE
jgi:hypothetical protein